MSLDHRGLALLAATILGWGFNWPAMKLLLEELPPFSMRMACGGIGVALIAGIALARGESLRVPRAVWPLLVLAALLNVTAWMGLAAFALLWLAAGEATIACYTMPIWASIFAWALLGEPITLRRMLALGMGFGGLVVLVLGQGVELGISKLPGIAVATASAVLFSLGAVVTKRWPLPLPPTSGVAWQMALGIAPLVLGAAIFDSPDFGALSGFGWAALLYAGLGPLGLFYITWFGALRRLPAGAATAGMLLTPVIGVVASAWLLGEPLGVRELAALGLTVGGVVLAVRG